MSAWKISTTDIGVDVGPIDPGNNSERVYNSESEMSSYLPTNVHKKKEKDIIHDQFLRQGNKHDWHIGSEPLSEFSVQYLAAMSFPTLSFQMIRVIQQTMLLCSMQVTALQMHLPTN